MVWTLLLIELEWLLKLYSYSHHCSYNCVFKSFNKGKIVVNIYWGGNICFVDKGIFDRSFKQNMIGCTWWWSNDLEAATWLDWLALYKTNYLFCKCIVTFEYVSFFNIYLNVQFFIKLSKCLNFLVTTIDFLQWWLPDLSNHQISLLKPRPSTNNYKIAYNLECNAHISESNHQLMDWTKSSTNIFFFVSNLTPEYFGRIDQLLY